MTCRALLFWERRYLARPEVRHTVKTDVSLCWWSTTRTPTGANTFGDVGCTAIMKSAWSRRNFVNCPSRRVRRELLCPWLSIVTGPKSFGEKFIFVLIVKKRKKNCYILLPQIIRDKLIYSVQRNINLSENISKTKKKLVYRALLNKIIRSEIKKYLIQIVD